MPELAFKDLSLLFEENKKIKPEVNQLVKKYLKDLHPRGWDIIDGVREYIKNNHFLIEAPINDPSFGGFIRSTNTEKFICYINTNQRRLYQNFSLLHELFHLIYFRKITESLHIVNVGLDSDSDERKADYFASLLLIDEHELISFYTGNENQDKDIFQRIILAMARFSAPYKAVLIRLFELDLIEIEKLEELFDKKVDLEKEFQALGLDPYVVERSDVVNFGNLEKLMDSNPLPNLAQGVNKQVFSQVMSYFSPEKDGDL
ncbi:ImmA/IrrE family metallo-endopeptidase [Domibacillus robiginosus]|uniref:ImmA/IrrE family metallo-endopeptidase n=1 Tax=Domibacillus robiginosus TaxID=1071054 RepID=UPI00067B7660|nr:ImmA/IrrE family metallo-endopeptidase [Domibacillus robiginosus]